MPLQSFVGEFLSFLERREERLLSWGFYNVRQSAEEIEEAFQTDAPEILRQEWATYSADGQTISELLRGMHRARLLYAIPGTIDTYRTRFAEGVRLTANLRQMFSEKDWATGSRLVSDVKIHLTPRVYPRRDRPADAVWAQLRQFVKPRDLELLEACFMALATKDGQPLRFAGFQERAFVHIFQKWGDGAISGSVVSAGTGSGKTKAFYIPSLLRIAGELRAPGFFTKVIGVYPRNVLLADQLREAVAETLKLRGVLQGAKLRPIRLGALLGSTPWNNSFDPRPASARQGRRADQWEATAGGFIIPHLKSPVDGTSDLIWRNEDRAAGSTALYRAGQTTPDVPNGVLALTREQLMERPPDILFASIEMLNREMGNPQWEKAFGLRQGERAPRMLLLDEVHAYEGIQGAQVAWVVRRWRHWAQTKSLHVVGLSATLKDAPDHLTRVAGVPAGQVIEFRPVPSLGEHGEMESEGMEYNLAIKGDPAAGTSLLSTSIQTGMLLRRLLTPRTQMPSAETQPIRPDLFFRRKVFGFTDNLDSINRWLNDMVDAESRGLARLRLPLNLRQPPPQITPVARARMDAEGQIWELPVTIGHNLIQPLFVSRCSSQDPGMDMNSDLIIATSSLEVGFDDPEVGAMLHHKKPRSMASFIQRKGRAGRVRGSRPWTVIVLSDYGADRSAFQSAERLFQPEVDALFLPVGNPFVLRIQAAMFLLDWLGERVGREISVRQGPYRYLSSRPSQRLGAARQCAAKYIRGLLEQGPIWQQFRRDLGKFFQYYSGSRDAAQANALVDEILWQEPRPLLTSGIPALLRKLEANWTRATANGSDGGPEDEGIDRPMPEFIPRATFSELDVAEGLLELQNFGNISREPQSLPIRKLLSEACPGRSSKYFATAQNEPGFWHPFSGQLVVGANSRSVTELFPRSFLLEQIDGVRVFQPEAVSLVHRPFQYLDSSNSSWDWTTISRTNGAGILLPIALERPWNGLFSESSAFLHSNGAWIELLRYAEGCEFEILNSRPQQRIRGILSLETRTNDTDVIREAVGYRMQVDGVRFLIDQQHLESRGRPSDELLSRVRTDYFLYRLKTSAQLSPLINRFQAEWIAQLSVAMLTQKALQDGVSLAEAQSRVSNNRPTEVVQVLDAIFQLRGVAESGQVEDAKLRTTLIDLWSNPAIVTEVAALESVLWQAPDEAFDSWLRLCYATTLGEAVCSAMCSMTDQVSEDDLDVDVLPIGGTFEIVVTEKSSGGIGQIERIVHAIRRRPRRFLDAAEFALARCPRADRATDVWAILSASLREAANGGGDLSASFESWRGAVGFAEQEVAKTSIRSAIVSNGVIPSRGTIVSLASKLLRPGSSPESDQLMHDLNRRWQDAGRDLGMSIPLRTFAYVGTKDAALRDRLIHLFEDIGAGATPTEPQLFAQAQQMLLEVCRDGCPDCLGQGGFSGDSGRPLRGLAREWLELTIDEVPVTLDIASWTSRAREALRTHGRVRLAADGAAHDAMCRGLLGLVHQEIDREGIFVPVAISETRQLAGRTLVTLHLKDFANE